MYAMAINMNISLIFYGESGEVEYGGSSETKNTSIYDIEYMKRVYLSGGHQRVLEKSALSKSELYFFMFPGEKDFEKHELGDFRFVPMLKDRN